MAAVSKYFRNILVTHPASNIESYNAMCASRIYVGIIMVWVGTEVRSHNLVLKIPYAIVFRRNK
jgi:hypothetical protein